MKALSLHVTGIVQGVGFRPFVYNLAVREGLAGWVLNGSDGVHVVVEGPAEKIEAFPAALEAEAPAMSVVERVIAEEVEPEGFSAFEIRHSEAEAGAMTLVSPDIATCPDCLGELRDPADRRHGYPFINCTNCGPRFTIIDDVPYDRPMTTMRDFPMCDECSAEYADPSDRRFHAQPNACFVCGPRLYLNPAAGSAEAGPGGSVLRQASPGARDASDDTLKSSDASSPAAELRAEPPGPAPLPLSRSEAEETSNPSGIGVPDDWRWSPNVDMSPRPHRDASAEAERSAAIIDAVVDMLREGAVVAIKGLGGFHLACDATNAAAVATLRERKHRWGKPLAIMVPDLDAARCYCDVNDIEADLLAGVVRPIVLLRRIAGEQAEPGDAARSSAAGTGSVGGQAGGTTRSSAAGAGSSENFGVFSNEPRAPREDCLSMVPPACPPLALGVADRLAEIGVMLPYTPLHHVLLGKLGGPLVMTSGNRSDEPIATENAEALERLGEIADAFLLHDREIHSRYDDSVVRVVDGIVEPVRRARGYAPHPLPLPFTTDTHILAAGPEQKNTFTLLKDDYAFVSQHIGDLENAETLESFSETLDLYKRLFRVEPHVIAHDLHPEYLSTKWALEQDLPKIGVQHHHAHIVSVTAEHGVSEPVIGFAFDGTGYGDDGRIWGGEVLVCDWSGYRRFAHLRYVPMPGGAGAIRRPARMAVGTLHALGLLDHPGAEPLRSRLAEGEERTMVAMIDQGLNSPLTSSMGRLFDAVAAIAGIADDAHYEGEAAILLEAAAEPSASGEYRFNLEKPNDTDSAWIIDSAPVLQSVLNDVAAGASPGTISARFHRSIVDCVVSVAKLARQETGAEKSALAGGVFMNRLVFGGAVHALGQAGVTPLTHKRLPVNDAAVSFGQAVVAWSRRHDL